MEGARVGGAISGSDGRGSGAAAALAPPAPHRLLEHIKAKCARIIGSQIVEDCFNKAKGDHTMRYFIEPVVREGEGEGEGGGEGEGWSGSGCGCVCMRVCICFRWV